MAIRAKLVIIFFTFIIVPMFLLWARWQGTAIASVKALLQQEMADRGKEISERLNATLKIHKDRVNELSQHPDLVEYAVAATRNPAAEPARKLQGDIAAFLQAYQTNYSSITTLNRQGVPLYRMEMGVDANGLPRPYVAGKNLRTEDLVPIAETISAGATSVSDIQKNEAGVYINLSAPIRNRSGEVLAGLLIRLRAENFLETTIGPRLPVKNNAQAKAVFGSRPEPIVINRDGVVLYTTDRNKEWQPYSSVFANLEATLNQMRAKPDKLTDEAGTWFFRQQVREESPRFSIFIVENYEPAISNLEFDSYVLLALTFLLVLVAMLALYYLISTLTDSIRRVTIGAKAIATGNLGYQINVMSKDETRVLAEAFNRMAARLRDMIRKEGEQKQFESFARLSSVLTHDLKNQILSLSLLVNNMERKFDREGFKEDAMRTLSESVNNLENLVTKLSDPRTPTKRIRDRSNITHLVERVLQRTAAQAANKFKVSTDLAPDIFATCDGKAVERVIENLVINALEAMPEGGQLKVATEQENGHAIIAVADTGKGMTKDFIDNRLFHPFATTKKKGIGLGLYSCRDIIEQHGGRIDVISKVDAGTEFKVVLPLTAPESNSGELRPILTI